MIVLHAVWLTSIGRLALWAENGGQRRTAPARRGRPPQRPRPRPHPFALDAEGIRMALIEFVGPVMGSLSDAAGMELMLRLPGADGGPIGSPWLDAESSELVFERLGRPSEPPRVVRPGPGSRLAGCLDRPLEDGGGCG